MNACLRSYWTGLSSKLRSKWSSKRYLLSRKIKLTSRHFTVTCLVIIRLLTNSFNKLHISHRSSLQIHAPERIERSTRNGTHLCVIRPRILGFILNIKKLMNDCGRESEYRTLLFPWYSSETMRCVFANFDWLLVQQGKKETLSWFSRLLLFNGHWKELWGFVPASIHPRTQGCSRDR